MNRDDRPAVPATDFDDVVVQDEEDTIENWDRDTAVGPADREGRPAEDD